MKRALLITESSVYTNPAGKLVVRGGGEMCFHNVAKMLLKLGIEPMVFAIQEFAGQKPSEVIEGVKYERFPVFSRTSLKLWKYLKEARKRAKDFDLVFLNQFTPHLILPWLKDVKKICVVHDVYQSEGDSFWLKQYGFLKGSLGNAVEKLQLYFDAKYADKVMTVSDFSERKIVDILGERIAGRIVKTPFPIKRAEFYVREKENFLLFVGRFVGYKQPEHALRALQKVQEVYPDFKLVFVAPRVEGDTHLGLESLRERLFVKKEDVIYKFEVDGEEMKELFAKAKILVQPSMNEGQGIVLLEALASGTPVVAYDLPAYDGMLLDGVNSRIVMKGDVDGLARGVLEILRNYESYHSGCECELERFSEEKFLQNLEKLCFN